MTTGPVSAIAILRAAPVLSVLLTSALPATVPSFQGSGDGVAVPRAAGRVTLDARLDSLEWSRAALRTSSGGKATLLLQHDGRFLYLGVRASVPGFASVCLETGDSVRILHASAALGSVRYGRAGLAWASADTAFTYGMRNPDSSAAARAERATYLDRHGWVATTFRMSGGRSHEMQIALEGLPRIAVAYFIPLDDNRWEIESWPGPGNAEGCSEPRLVRGFVPRPLRFRPVEWADLVLSR